MKKSIKNLATKVIQNTTSVKGGEEFGTGRRISGVVIGTLAD